MTASKNQIVYMTAPAFEYVVNINFTINIIGLVCFGPKLQILGKNLQLILKINVGEFKSFIDFILN